MIVGGWGDVGTHIITVMTHGQSVVLNNVIVWADGGRKWVQVLVGGSCERDNRGRRPSRFRVNTYLPELFRVLKDFNNCYSFSLIYRVLKMCGPPFYF